jgi:DNA primase
MGLIPDDTIDEIRRRVDIVAVIGQHVQLRKAGINHKGLCPFHQENTPSFNVNAEKGFFYCFGCQKKGDAFSFVMEYEGKSFLEAARALAAQVGVIIPEREMSPAEKRERSEKSKLYEVNKIALRFFREQLAGDATGARARQYLEQRGMTMHTADRFDLGYGPDSWDAMGNYLASRGVPVELALKAGLLKQRKQSSGTYDAFRDRLVCPVILPGGEVAGFSGRRLADGDDAGAKYINSPESAAYKKSHLLFGIHLARDAFRLKKRALVVEGNFDVVVLHQFGFEETVAPLGTALTEPQVSLLRRQAENVVLVYDGDKAGRAATLKALKVLVAAGVTTRIAVLPMGEDPDSLVRADPDRFETIIERAQPGVEYFIYDGLRGDASSANRARIVAEAAELIRAVPDTTRRDLLVGVLANAMGTDVRVTRRALSEALQGRNVQVAETIQSVKKTGGPPPRGELEIVAILADHPKLQESADRLDVLSLLTHATLRDMYSAAREGHTVLSALPDDAHPDIAKHVFAGAYASLNDPEATLEQAVQRLRTVNQNAELAELQVRAVDAGRRGDVEEQRQLLKEIVTIRRRSTSNGENL